MFAKHRMQIANRESVFTKYLTVKVMTSVFFIYVC